MFNQVTLYGLSSTAIFYYRLSSKEQVAWQNDDTLNQEIFINNPKRYREYKYERYMILFQKMV
ncbi:UNVERIFIED_CONTAM: hypothetical protein ABIC26_003037 [Paenibacillus sp. PvR008]